MATELETFTFPKRGKERTNRFESILDGKIWKVNPEEFGFEDQPKDFIKAVKSDAKQFLGRYVRACQTLDGHVVLQLLPESYVPRIVGGRKAKQPK